MDLSITSGRKISLECPSLFTLKSFRNIDTLPDIIRLKPSQVTQYKARNSLIQENQYVLFQMYLRSGMEDGIRMALKTVEIESKFHFDLNLQSLRNEDRAPNQILLPQKRRSKRKTINKKTGDVEKGLNKYHKTIPTSNNNINAQIKTNEEMISSILADIIKDSINGRDSSKPCPDPAMTVIPVYNQTMTLNALHLAILSKQSGSVKCIMNHTLSNENKDNPNVVNTLIRLLSNEVEIDYKTDKFTKHEQALDGMNALHLCCQYHPDALNVIFEAITDYEKKCSNDQTIGMALKTILEHKNRVMDTTPLHIAVKRSLVDAVR